GRRFRQHFCHNLLERGRKWLAAGSSLQSRRSGTLMLEHGVDNVTAPERRGASKRFIKSTTKRINIRAGVYRAGLALLWAHVIGATADFSDICQLLAGAGIVRQLDYAKVYNFDAAAGLCCIQDDNVWWFY